MRTRFDEITDDEIEQALATLDHLQPYPETGSDLIRIPHLSWWMFYWKSWIGTPVTVFRDDAIDFDGHHRMRSVKFIARRRNYQVQVPLRFSCTMSEQ